MIKNISIIGAGNLARCFVERIITSKKNYKVFLYDVDKKKNKYSSVRNVNFYPKINQNLSESQLILLAIKPHDFKSVLNLSQKAILIIDLIPPTVFSSNITE